MTAAARDRMARLVPLLFAIAFLGAVYGLPLLRLAKNRLVVGEPVYALDGAGIVAGFGPEIEAVSALVLGAALLARAGRTRVGL
ncbi:hypothetical protein FV219_26785, partial [Methylobacterium sp. WL122]